MKKKKIRVERKEKVKKTDVVNRIVSLNTNSEEKEKKNIIGPTTILLSHKKQSFKSTKSKYFCERDSDFLSIVIEISSHSNLRLGKQK